jgi:hypothetical protein
VDDSSPKPLRVKSGRDLRKIERIVNAGLTRLEELGDQVEQLTSTQRQPHNQDAGILDHGISSASRVRTYEQCDLLAWIIVQGIRTGEVNVAHILLDVVSELQSEQASDGRSVLSSVHIHETCSGRRTPRCRNDWPKRDHHLGHSDRSLSRHATATGKANASLPPTRGSPSRGGTGCRGFAPSGCDWQTSATSHEAEQSLRGRACKVNCWLMLLGAYQGAGWSLGRNESYFPSIDSPVVSLRW